MRENEKEQERLEALKQIPWYKRNESDDEPTYGVCEKCG
jgi:RNA polymerase-binding transcription factor DksA